MNMPFKNVIYDLINKHNSIIDTNLVKLLSNNGYAIPEDKFNKILLDLEISGFIKVSWITKNTRRIEMMPQESDMDEVDIQNKEMMKKDYEASFPGV
ncbi:MAG: hypothetical protein OXF28_01185 [Thaumarchaeota archaeon]|nr:hypothetical protein [Nitrososphaerota archaeon]